MILDVRLLNISDQDLKVSIQDVWSSGHFFVNDLLKDLDHLKGCSSRSDHFLLKLVQTAINLSSGQGGAAIFFFFFNRALTSSKSEVPEVIAQECFLAIRFCYLVTVQKNE